MLPSKKDISNVQAPWLMQIANGDWQLVISVKNANSFTIEILERNNGEFSKRMICQDEPPFYVGADVWELNYGATLMTLKHETLAGHPAQQLWTDWLSHNQ